MEFQIYWLFIAVKGGDLIGPIFKGNSQFQGIDFENALAAHF